MPAEALGGPDRRDHDHVLAVEGRPATLQIAIDSIGRA
jgi:hypothetical protein